MLDSDAPVGWTFRHTLLGYPSRITCVVWTPNGRLLVVASDDGMLRILDVEAKETLRVLRHSTNPILDLAVTPDGRTLVSGTEQSLKFWEIATGKNLRTIAGFGPTVKFLTSDGQQVITCLVNSSSREVTIVIFDLESEEQLPLETFRYRTDLKTYRNYIPLLAVTPDGRYAVATSKNGKALNVWHVPSGNLKRVEGKSFTPSLEASPEILSLTITPDGERLFAGSNDSRIYVYDLRTWRLESVLEGHTQPITGVSTSSDGSLLLSKDRRGIVRLWDCDDWRVLSVLEDWRVLLRSEEKDDSIYHSAPPTFHPRQNDIIVTAGGEGRFSALGTSVLDAWDLDLEMILGRPASVQQVHYITAKLVLVGDSGVGKTGLGWRLTHGEYKEHPSSHGQQFWVINELGTKRKDGTECEAVLWDLAGQHVFRPVHAIFLDDVDLALVLFDPTNRQEPLKGVESWLKQLSGKQKLPPTVLIGARIDLGDPVLSQQELEQFCQRHGISGGYISTSARTRVGINELLDILKAQIPWEQMTATVTTATFKRIKEYVLALKENPDRQGVLMRPTELRQQLQSVDPEWQFTNAEMMRAVKHLENHGYVAILRSSSGGESILLTPELLVDLASSIVLQADKHPRELGALNETLCLRGGYPFQELANLEWAEQQILLDAAVVRFLSHNICFRETLGAETLLIFPGLIKQKRPLLDEFETLEDISYIVRGRVENVYSALVVLLGHTPTFTHVNQWQNQAQYEMGEGQICGFRLIEEREGEIELVLYYSAAMPAYGRKIFQGLFEKFLYERDAEVTLFPPVICSNNHRQERTIVVKRLREGKTFLFCEECGEQISLPEIEEPLVLGTQETRWVQREEVLAYLRSAYETYLVRVKGFRRDRAVPRCYISHLPEQASWVSQLAHDLRDAGVLVLEDRAQVEANDFVILVCTPAYKEAWECSAEPIAVDANLVLARLHQATTLWPTIVPLLRKGSPVTAHSDAAIPLELDRHLAGDFRDETHYTVSLFDLVLTLYAIPLDHPTSESFREALQKRWEEMLGRIEKADTASLSRIVASTASGGPDKEIFISYAWGDESEAIANELDRAFQARGVAIVRDKRDLGFKGRIKAFMESIGRGKCVILIISDKYLKSANCLFELLQVAKHGDFAQRIFPIVLDDACIYKPLDSIHYVQYWEQEREKLDAAMKTVSQAHLHGFREDIDLYDEIRALLPRLADILKDMNALTLETHRRSDFAGLFKAVMTKLSD